MGVVVDTLPLRKARQVRNFLDSLVQKYEAGDTGVAGAIERIYFQTFGDWGGWLEEETVTDGPAN